MQHVYLRAGQTGADLRNVVGAEQRVALSPQRHGGRKAGEYGGIHAEALVDQSAQLRLHAGAHQRAAHVIQHVVGHAAPKPLAQQLPHALPGQDSVAVPAVERAVQHPVAGESAVEGSDGRAQDRGNQHLAGYGLRHVVRHGERRQTGAAVGDQVPELGGVARGGVDLVQYAPHQLRTGLRVLGHAAAAGGEAVAGQIHLRHQAALAQQLRYHQPPVEHGGQRRVQEQHAPRDRVVLRAGDAIVDAQSAKAEITILYVQATPSPLHILVA